MIEAYLWAKKNKIKVAGFDFDINVFAGGKTEKDNQKLMEEQDKVVQKHNWKDFNNRGFLELLDKDENNLVDKGKFKLRQEKMFENIRKNLIKSGTIIILIGAGHLAFFENKFPNAIFPLRN